MVLACEQRKSPAPGSVPRHTSKWPWHIEAPVEAAALTRCELRLSGILKIPAAQEFHKKEKKKELRRTG